MSIISSGSELILQCILILFQSLISMRYLKKSLKYLKKETIYIPVLLFLGLLISFGLSRMLGTFTPFEKYWNLMYLAVPAVLLFTCLCFYDRKMTKAAVVVYFGLMVMILKVSTDRFLWQLQAYHYASEVGRKYYYVISGILASHIFFIGLSGGMHFFDHEGKLALPDLLYLIVNMLCIISVLFVVGRFHLFSDSLVRIQGMVCLFIFVISAATVPFYHLILSSVKELNEEEKRRESEALREKYYTDVHNEYEAMRELKHDMKNQLRAAEVLMEKDQTEEARAYLQTIEENISDYIPAATGIPEIDAAISAKKLDLEKLKIRLELKLCSLHDLPVTAFEMNSVIMNLVDNAKESLLREKIPQPYVTFSIQRIRGMLMVTCSNPLAEIDPRVKAGILKTSKKEAGHGLGLKIIQGVADKYSGVFTIRLKDGCFHAILSIPWEDQK